MAVDVSTLYGVDNTGATDSSPALNAAIANGGSFYFPEGTYCANSLSYVGGKDLIFFGDGSSTILILNNSTANFLMINGGSFTGHNFTMKYPTQGGATAGTFFIFENGRHTLHDVSFINGNNLATWGSGCTGGGAYNISAIAPTGNGFQVDVSWNSSGQQYGVIQFSGLTFQAISNNVGAALSLISGDSIWVSDSNLAGFKSGVQAITNASHSYLANVRFSGVFCDGAGGPSNSGDGWYFDGTNALLGRIFFTDCWAGTMGSTGMYFKNVKGVEMSGMEVIQNGLHGIIIDTGVQDFTMRGGKVTGNSRNTPGICHGIVVLAGYNVTFDGVRSGPTYNGVDLNTQVNSQGYGIIINSNAVTEYSIINCDLRGNTSSSLQDLGGGTQGVTKNVSCNFIGSYP